MTADRVPTVPGLTGLSVLARGGYATVFRAMQESVGRLVAVKVENRILESERDQRRFMREARAAGRMSSHPHVVDLFDAGVTISGHPFLIMELCRGSYSDRMRTVPLMPHEARDVGVKIADALADAHELGVLHRDVKPANILMTDFGEPALADFGLAILAENRDVSITLDVLTPAYAPPEMFQHAKPASPADVYSLCTTLYALMAGRPPRWPGSRDPSLVSLVDMFHDPIPDLPHVSRELMALILRGMSNDPGQRPTAAQLRDLLLAMELGAVPTEALPPRAPGVGPPGAAGPAGRGGPPGAAGPAGAGSRDARPAAFGGALEQALSPSIGAGSEHPVPGPAVDPFGPAPGVPVGSSGVSPGVHPAALGGFGGARPVAANVVLSDPTINATDETQYVTGDGVPQQPRGRRRTLVWATLGVAYVVLLGGVVATGLYLRAQRPAATFVGPPPGPVCPLNPTGTARCVSTPECFDRIAVANGVVRATPISCADPHQWEVFASGRLPDGVDPASYLAIKQNSQVRQVCSAANAKLLNAEEAWQVDVLPPARDAAADRTYRCVAGRPPTRLRDSRFTP